MVSFRRVLKTFRERSWRDWWILLYTGSLTILVRAGLSIFSLRQVARGLHRAATQLPQRKALASTYQSRAVWAARTAGRLLLEQPCLTQALVLQYLLLRRGDASTRLRIGVAKGNEDELQAHAWVERRGRVLIGGENSPTDYTRFGELGKKIDPSQGVSSG